MTALPRSPQSYKVRADKAKEALNRKLFIALCEQRGLPKPETEYRFITERRYAFDYAFPDQRVALEVVGGIWVRGAHSRGKHQLSDMTKRNLAQLRGWRVLEVPPDQLFASETIDMLKLAMQPHLPCSSPSGRSTTNGYHEQAPDNARSRPPESRPLQDRCR